MRATAVIRWVTLGVVACAPVAAQAQTVCTSAWCEAYAVDNGGGPAGPNAWQASIPVTAQVGSQCEVVTGGTPPGGADFGATVNLGTISDANGHLSSALSGSTSGSAPVSQSFQVSCSGAANAFTLQATPLATSVDAPAGYANSVNYMAEVDFVTTGAAVDYAHASDGVTQNQNLPTGVGLASVADNVTIKAYGFNTAHTGSDILVASPNYQGVITVTVSAGT